MAHRCRYCGRSGHNKRTCPEHIADFGKKEAKKGTNRCSFCGEHGHIYKKCSLYAEAQVWYDNETASIRNQVSLAFSNLKIGLGSLVHVLHLSPWWIDYNKELNLSSPLILSLLAETLTAVKGPFSNWDAIPDRPVASLGIGEEEKSVGLPIKIKVDQGIVTSDQGKQIVSELLEGFQEHGERGGKSLASLLLPYANKRGEVYLAKLFCQKSYIGWVVVLPGETFIPLGLKIIAAEEESRKRQLFKKRNEKYRPFGILGYSSFRKWREERAC